MADVREPSHPPSEPKSSGLRPSDAGDAGLRNADAPVRIQLFVALLLGLVLVATGLYLWRRPRSGPETAAGDVAASADAAPATQALVGDAGIAAAVAAQAEAGAAASVLSLSESRILGCHDKGPKKTAPEECDHLPPIEDALAKAINDSAACVPGTAGGGTIDYVLDVSFNRKKNAVKLSLPKGSRSMKNAKAIAACKSAVTRGIHDVSVDGVTHGHARYEIGITATYPGAVKAPAK
jgi:hypothetical protein